MPDAPQRALEVSVGLRPWFAALTVAFVACTSTAGQPSGTGGSAGAATAPGGSSGRGDSGTTNTGQADALVIPGPCTEGMECNGNDPGGSPQFHCVCAAGSWICPTHDSKGWLTADLPLPAADPHNGTSCTGANFACTLPDRCGGLCICNQAGTWVCKTLLGEVDGGVITMDGTADVVSPSSPEAGCRWPSCSVYGATRSPAAQCFTPICFSTAQPSGDPFFTAGASGCAVEH
jgi:hypothetical protein